jgi:hypothetical protein
MRRNPQPGQQLSLTMPIFNDEVPSVLIAELGKSLSEGFVARLSNGRRAPDAPAHVSCVAGPPRPWGVSRNARIPQHRTWLGIPQVVLR